MPWPGSNRSLLWTKHFVHDPRAPSSTSWLVAKLPGRGTWARARKREEPHAIIFDAILVKKSERQPILLAAGQHQVPAVAVWLQTPLQVCLERNAARPTDEVVGEQGLKNVFAALEPPELSEGFAQVLEVKHDDA